MLNEVRVSEDEATISAQPNHSEVLQELTTYSPRSHHKDVRCLDGAEELRAHDLLLLCVPDVQWTYNPTVVQT